MAERELVSSDTDFGRGCNRLIICSGLLVSYQHTDLPALISEVGRGHDLVCYALLNWYLIALQEAGCQ
jgi:hypothetical protein